MVILKNTSTLDEEKDTIFIGAKIQKDVVSFLSLYCASIGVTKTSVIKSVLNEWYQDKIREENAQEVLITSTAKRAFKIWKEGAKRGRTFVGFCNTLETELQYKISDKKIITKILEKLKYEATKG